VPSIQLVNTGDTGSWFQMTWVKRAGQAVDVEAVKHDPALIQIDDREGKTVATRRIHNRVGNCVRRKPNTAEVPRQSAGVGR